MILPENNYFITSERLGFSKWKEAHFSLAKKLWGDIAVTKLIDSRGRLNDDQIKEKLELEIANEERYGVQYFPLFLLESKEFIGCCGLRPYDLSNNIYEIGFHLTPEHWGQGYAKEAAIRTIAYAFEELSINELFAGHNPNNHASRQLLLQLGFTYIRDEYFAPTGLSHPSYKLTIENFQY
ncbi:MAG TPA: GNAT family N-acetyltransferase [Arenibacter sp.]|nr:GNAT family N-acetyltransferase [Arenibacter sp.]